MTRNAVTDARRLSHAIDRLDAVSATDREAAAKHVFDVCVYHVTRVRKTHPGPHHRGRGRLSSISIPPTPHLVFDIVYPHIYRIARRLDRAMRYAEASPHPADAAALIVAVDAQGALAALFAVAQNAGVSSPELDALALPLRKRSAPALLRTLFSPDMRVANAAKKALRQFAAIASCQTTPWMSTIRAGLSLRSGAKVNRSILLRNLLSSLAEILHIVVRQAAMTLAQSHHDLPRKRSSRSSFGTLIVRPRPSLTTERKAQERAREKAKAEKSGSFFKALFRRKQRAMVRNVSNVSLEEPESSETSRKRFRASPSRQRQTSRGDIMDDVQSNGSHGAASNAGSYPGSAISTITEGTVSSPRPSQPSQRRSGATIRRDAATAMYIFERLLAKRTNPELDDRIEVISTLAEIASASFSGQYVSRHKIEVGEEYTEAMAAVFNKHGQRIYSVVLDVLFRPVREADAKRIGVFSFHETGFIDFGMGAPFTRRKLAEFPQSAICLPNMDCTGLAAVSCNSLLKVFLRYVPEVCSQRMALLTGTINTAFLHASEALKRTQDGCSWEISKLVSAVDALTVLVSVIPATVESALELIIGEPVTLRLVIETCIRSVSATGRLLAQNAARPSAPKLSDEGTLDSLRTWQALIRIVPGTSAWSGTPSYSSSILFLAQVARRAALLSVLQGYKQERYRCKRPEESIGDETYPSASALKMTVPGTTPGSVDDGNASTPSATTGSPVGCGSEEENMLTSELHQCIVAMIGVPGTSPGDVFFELYRTVVYLYANDLKKQHQRMGGRKGPPELQADPEPSDVISKTLEIRDRSSGRLSAPSREMRSQSDEDAKGILVENIAVDGQLPSRALRRAVMASELDLGEYFDEGQPPSLQHLGSQPTGLPPGMHTFEEFSHALAIIIGTLTNKTITENFEDPHEAEAMISRDVQRSGSAYLKRVHKRAKSILRLDIVSQGFDWRNMRYEERIKKLEEQVASLKSMVQASIEDSVYMSKRKSLPKILGRSHGSLAREHLARELQRNEHVHEVVCGPSRCFCVT